MIEQICRQQTVREERNILFKAMLLGQPSSNMVPPLIAQQAKKSSVGHTLHKFYVPMCGNSSPELHYPAPI